MTTDCPSPLDAGVARLVAQLRADVREVFEERAAIMEFDGGLRRLEAERQALIQTLSRHGVVGASQLRLLRFRAPSGTRFALVDALGDEFPGQPDGEEVDLLATLRGTFRGAARLTPVR